MTDRNSLSRTGDDDWPARDAVRRSAPPVPPVGGPAGGEVPVVDPLPPAPSLHDPGYAGDHDHQLGDGAGDVGGELDDATELDADDDQQRNRTRNLVEWIVVIAGALVVALLIKTFLFQAFYIPSESMVPTLEVGDRVIVNKLSDGTNRGDLIVFAKPEGEGGTVQDLIKRVIGLPGETVSARGNQIYIDKNDGNGPQPLDEPYLPEGTVTNDFQGTPIPEDSVFVMGDNRDDSRDSRFFGPIPESDIVGRAFLRVWPPSEIGLL